MAPNESMIRIVDLARQKSRRDCIRLLAFGLWVLCVNHDGRREGANHEELHLPRARNGGAAKPPSSANVDIHQIREGILAAHGKSSDLPSLEVTVAQGG